MAATHALGKALSFGAMVVPFALMLSAGPHALLIIMTIVSTMVIAAAITKTVFTVNGQRGGSIGSSEERPAGSDADDSDDDMPVELTDEEIADAEKEAKLARMLSRRDGNFSPATTNNPAPNTTQRQLHLEAEVNDLMGQLTTARAMNHTADESRLLLAIHTLNTTAANENINLETIIAKHQSLREDLHKITSRPAPKVSAELQATIDTAATERQPGETDGGSVTMISQRILPGTGAADPAEQQNQEKRPVIVNMYTYPELFTSPGAHTHAEWEEISRKKNHNTQKADNRSAATAAVAGGKVAGFF